MSAKQQAPCPECGEAAYTSRRTFLGFERRRCGACESVTLGPLTGSTRVLYWVGAILFAGGAFVAVNRGQLPLPGLVAVGSVWGILRDASIRRASSASSKRPTTAS